MALIGGAIDAEVDVEEDDDVDFDDATNDSMHWVKLGPPGAGPDTGAGAAGAYTRPLFRST